MLSHMIVKQINQVEAPQEARTSSRPKRLDPQAYRWIARLVTTVRLTEFEKVQSTEHKAILLTRKLSHEVA